MRDDVFGEATEADKGENRQLLALFPCRCANSVEAELRGEWAAASAVANSRMIFVEDDRWNAADFAEYGELTAHEALALTDIIADDVGEHYRRQIILARELGESATRELYLIACEAEGIEPLIGGDGYGFNI